MQFKVFNYDYFILYTVVDGIHYTVIDYDITTLVSCIVDVELLGNN